MKATGDPCRPTSHPPNVDLHPTRGQPTIMLVRRDLIPEQPFKYLTKRNDLNDLEEKRKCVVCSLSVTSACPVQGPQTVTKASKQPKLLGPLQDVFNTILSEYFPMSLIMQ